MHIFMFAAALRKDSLNKKLIQLAADFCKAQQHEVDLADFADFALPLYDGDLENINGVPQGAKDFVARMQQSDAIIIASPEYNHSMSGILKNLIDWVSRLQPMPWKNQHILLLSASPALAGGNRGLWALRMPLEYCGSFVYPDMYSLPLAHQAFDDKQQLLDAKANQRLEAMIRDFIAHATRCSK